MTFDIEFPPNVDEAAVLEPMNGAAWKHSPEARRCITENDPLRFALTYFTGDEKDGRPNHLASRWTGGRVSFSRMHVDMYSGARRWGLLDDPPIREGWIAPRDSAKSTTMFLILPLWALAHGRANYVMAFASSKDQAAGHLANLRRELERNTLLRQDYPELRPATGRGARNTTLDLDFAGGSAMSARGMDSDALGARTNNNRPDLLIGDDMEPKGSTYSPEQKAKRLATLIETILPMNDRAVVQLVGTVTMYGSIMHDLVLAALGEQTAEWITAEGFRPRYYPPIKRLRNGSEESCWPARWSLDTMRSKRDMGGNPGGSVTWRLNYLNQPPRAGEDGVGWRKSMFRWGTPRTERPKMFVDIAVTSKRGADQTAITVIAPTLDGRRVVVYYCRGYRINPEESRNEVHRVARLFGVDEVHVETNQGQDYVLDRFRPMPAGIKLLGHNSGSHKETRLMDLLDMYERSNVIHAESLTELEQQLLDHHAKSKHDDLADVVSIGVGKLLKGSVRL